MSVCESLEALRGYVYGSDHIRVFRGPAKWFEKMDQPNYCLWWIPVGHRPSVAYSFWFSQQFPQPAYQGVTAYPPSNGKGPVAIAAGPFLNSCSRRNLVITDGRLHGIRHHHRRGTRHLHRHYGIHRRLHRRESCCHRRGIRLPTRRESRRVHCRQRNRVH
jgi:Domain of unknown function (DUF3291)